MMQGTSILLFSHSADLGLTSAPIKISFSLYSWSSLSRSQLLLREEEEEGESEFSLDWVGMEKDRMGEYPAEAEAEPEVVSRRGGRRWGGVESVCQKDGFEARKEKLTG